MRVVMVNRGMGIYRGGGEVYDLRLADQLVAAGAGVEFVAGLSLGGQPKAPAPPGSTTYVRTPYLRAFAQSLPRLIRPPVSEADMLMFERAAFQRVRRLRPDVAHLSGMPVLASWLRRRLGIPTVLIFHGPPRRLFTPFIRRCSAVVSYGDALHQIRRVRPDTVDIPPGVDPGGTPGRRDVRRELRIPQGAFIVLFMGRLVPIKNLPLLIDGFARAAAEAEALHLIICGEGQMRVSLEQRARDLGLAARVHWAGYIPHEEVGDFYAAADAFVITSQYDNFPFVVLEAMNAGLPVVATRVGGIPLQVEEGRTGWLVRPNDPDDLARGILALARDPATARRMGETARERIRRQFNWAASARKLLEVYEHAVRHI